MEIPVSFNHGLGCPRREFIGSTTAAAGAVAAAGLATAQSANASADKRGVSSKRARPGAPNVILILVDEMRFPMTLSGWNQNTRGIPFGTYA